MDFHRFSLIFSDFHMKNKHRIYADLSDFKRFQRTLIDGEIDGEIAGNLGANLGANPVEKL